MIRIYLGDGPNHCRVVKNNQEGTFGLDTQPGGGLDWVAMKEGATPPLIHKAEFIFWADERL